MLHIIASHWATYVYLIWLHIIIAAILWSKISEVQDDRQTCQT
jgi:hypothetical protein